MALVAGIDAGTENNKLVILRGSDIVYSVSTGLGIESTGEALKKMLHRAATEIGIAVPDIERIVATGMGRGLIPFVHEEERDAKCLARGVHRVFPSARTALDIGTQKVLPIRCERGKAIRSASQDKCAAGSGKYLEMVAKILGVAVEEMAGLSLRSTEEVEVSSTCAVFAETEIVSLIHMRKKPEDISKGVFRSLARRIYPLLIMVNFEKDVVVTGGVARNAGLVAALAELIKCELVVPENPEMIPALGAAFLAQERTRA